jgi:riboflavin kinase, archaea type
MDEILLLLLSQGAHKRPLRLTTAEIGSQCGMSQQNASRKLALLSEGGYIERGKDGIRLTRRACDEAAALYSALKGVFEGGKLELDGTIVKGLGEGGFYMSLPGYRRQITEKLGFDPFPGTLNVRLDAGEEWKRRQLLEGEPIIISGFRDKDRTFGDLFAYRCSVAGKGGAVIVPLRTHHGPEILELVFGFNAKKALRKKDGDRVKVSV